MRKGKLLLATWLILSLSAPAQDAEAPNYSNAATLPGGAGNASKAGSAEVNLFTGTPDVSVPIYNYKSNSGLALSVGLQYTGGGGIQVGESPSIVGLGWYLNAGGSIVRTVRGMPDDMPTYGYMYAGAIPTDFRSNASKYYFDSLDTQQDIFQYNFPGHSGKFVIGKNGQIASVPLSKVRIIPTYQTATSLNQTLKSFRIIGENGVKYDFENIVHTWMGLVGSGFAYMPSGYFDKPYATSWELTRIISPFNTDTIKFEYSAREIQYGFKLPQVTFVNNSNGSRKGPTYAPGVGITGSYKISSIEFPDKTTLSFVYSNKDKYTSDDYALSKIKISDTAFRYGFLFEYQNSYVSGYGGGRGGHTYTSSDSTKLLLKSVIPFTSKERQDGYQFDYTYPLFPKGSQDSIGNKRDHWGYYNGAVNLDNLIPSVNGYTWGADRTPNSGAVANSLYRCYLPNSGYVEYSYELNTHYPYTKTAVHLSITPTTNSQNTVSFSQVFNDKHQVVFLLDKSVSRVGSAPISGSGDLNVYIKSTDGSVTYHTTAVSSMIFFTRE